MVRVCAPEAFWDEHLNRLAQKLVAHVAEKALGFGIHERDYAACVDKDDRVRCCFEHSAKASLKDVRLALPLERGHVTLVKHEQHIARIGFPLSLSLRRIALSRPAAAARPRKLRIPTQLPRAAGAPSRDARQLE
jgi:hypothetical protein